MSILLPIVVWVVVVVSMVIVSYRDERKKRQLEQSDVGKVTDDH